MAHGSFGHLLVAVEQPVVGGTVTGTAAITAAKAVVASSGTSTTGTAAITAAKAVVSASGTATGSTVTGTAAITAASAVVASSGVAYPTGTAAITAAKAVVASAGTFGSTTYILNDDFSGSSIDSSQWLVYNRLGDQDNGELNAVTPANVVVTGGNMEMTGKFEDVVAGDTTTGAPNPRTVHYTSGQIAQKATPFLYGDVQVRAQIAGGTGFWPCIWMLGYLWQPSQPFTADVVGSNWPHDGWCEIDIAEFMAGNRTQVNNVVHYQVSGGTHLDNLPFDATSRFMVYRLVWTPTSLTWMLDAEDGNGWITLRTVTGVAGTDIPNVPMYLIINMAIGGIGGGTPDSATFPQTMKVDYARVAMTANSVNNGSAAIVAGSAVVTASGTATGATVTGSAAITAGKAVVTASGTATPPTVTGSAAITAAPATVTASGTANPPGVFGTAAITAAKAVVTAVGTATPPTVTGSAAVTATKAVVTANGSTTTGTVAVTAAKAVVTATGFHARFDVPGNATLTLTQSGVSMRLAGPDVGLTITGGGGPSLTLSQNG